MGGVRKLTSCRAVTVPDALRAVMWKGPEKESDAPGPSAEQAALAAVARARVEARV